MVPLEHPALRYHGGKFRLAPWIVSHFPPHVCYVEPFGGAMSVLLTKRPSRYEVYNDADGDVVAFFRVLREQPRRLSRAILLTPCSREECRRAWDPAPDGDDLERARRLYVRCLQSRGTHADRHGFSQWRFQRQENGYSVCANWSKTEHLMTIAARLKQVQIECDTALAVIRRYDRPETVFYLDPPYLASTRKRPDHGYAHEMTEEEHHELADALHQVKGMVLLSGYSSALYECLYAGWERKDALARNQVSDTVTECLWLSPSCRQLQSILSLGI